MPESDSTLRCLGILALPEGYGSGRNIVILPERYVHTARLKDFHKLSSLIEPLMPGGGDQPIGGATQAELERRWPRCAGRAAELSFPLLFRSGRLVIFTESAIWATELRHQAKAIETALDDLGVTATDIRATPQIFPQRRRYQRKLSLSDSSARNMGVTAEGLTDPDLRQALKRLATRRSN